MMSEEKDQKEENMAKYLFSIDAKFEDELNKEIVSDDLKDKFRTEGYSPSSCAMVTKEKENEWVILIMFIVRKEDGKLNIYEKEEEKGILNSMDRGWIIDMGLIEPDVWEAI